MTARAKKPWSKADTLPCKEIYDDDGIDPRFYFKKSQSHSSDRKVWQLCHQVKQTLQLLWAGIEDLIEWEIQQVVPAPNASRLEVVVISKDSKTSEQDISDLRDTIKSNKSSWRNELANDIHRKRVPELIFQILVFGEKRVQQKKQ